MGNVTEHSKIYLALEKAQEKDIRPLLEAIARKIASKDDPEECYQILNDVYWSTVDRVNRTVVDLAKRLDEVQLILIKYNRDYK